MLRRIRITAFNLLANGIAASSACPRLVRYALLRIAGVQTQSHRLGPHCHFGPNLMIGKGTFVSHRCFFDTTAPVTIGARCHLAVDVLVGTATHEVGPPAMRAAALVGHPITIGDGVWIGSRATILPGVTIGDGCIIAAGALVREDCEPNALYAGVPARMVRTLPA